MAQKKEKLLTVNEVAEMIGLSKSTLYAGLLGTDQLKRVQFQTTPTSRITLRFVESDVLAWLDRKLNPPVVVVEAPKRRRGVITEDQRIVDMFRWKEERG